MLTAVFWGLVAAVLALRLTPLGGIVVGVLAAVFGVVLNVSMVFTSGAVLLGAVNTDPGMARVAEAGCLAVFAVCAVMLAGVIHALSTGSFWPRSWSRR